MNSKTLILSSQNKFLSNSPRAILTIIGGNMATGKIRLYNIDKLNEKVKLGIYYDDRVLTANLAKVDDHYEFFLNENLNMNYDIYCALVDTSNKNQVVLCGGSYSGMFFTDEEPVSPLTYIDNEFDEETETEIDTAIKNCNENFDEAIKSNDSKSSSFDTKQQAQDILSKSDNNAENCLQNKIFFDNSKGIINTTNDTANSCEYGKCKNCEYKQYFFDQNLNKADLHEQESFKQGQFEQTSNSSQQCANQDKAINSFCNRADDDTDKDCFDNKQNKNNKTVRFDELDTINSTACENMIQPTAKPTNNEKTDTAEGEQFLSSVIEQLEEMFKEYPADETIMNIIPNSKIIKVTDSIDDTSYIVGTMLDDDQIKYLIYGVPALYNTAPPKELGSNYQWLPLDPDDPMSDGYYLIYTDIKTGKQVPINIE